MKKAKFIETICIIIASIFILYSVERFISMTGDYNSQRYKKAEQNTSYPNCSILFISSYSLTNEATRVRLSGFSQTIEKYDIDTILEFMHMNDFNTQENLDLFYENISYKVKTAEHPPKVIIAEGNYALQFVKEHHEELFKGLPVLFFGVTDYELAQSVRNTPLFSGEIEDLFIDDIVRIATDLFPKINHVLIVTDDSANGKSDQKQISTLAAQFPGYLFSVLNTSKITRDELKESFSHIQDDRIVIFLNASEDIQKKFFSQYETINFVAKNLSAPIFSDSYDSIGKGFVGSYMSNHFVVGERAAKKTLKILNGTDISEIAYSVNNNGIYVFDLNMLKKYNLKRYKLPSDSLIVNSDDNFFIYNRAILVPTTMFFFGIILIMGVLAFYMTRFSKLMQIRKHEHTHDYLTGLYNRPSLRQSIDEEILKKEKFTLILVDIDDFRIINDLYFHDCGDAILKETAERLTSILNDKDFEIARCFSDNFLIIIKNEVLTPGNKILKQINAELSEVFIFGGFKVALSVSAGVDVFTENDKKTCDEILVNVEMARDIAKLEGKNRTVFFTSDIKAKKIIEKEIADTLDEAISHNGFTVLFQPQIDVKTGEVYGFEALSRLTSGKYNPAQFIPVAEQNAMIPQIGRIVTEKAIRQMSRWKKDGIPLKKMAINFSAGQLADRDYVSYLENLLEVYDIPAELVEIEITESLFIGNSKKATELFDKFKKIGVHLALDDFGTGYSSLSYLTYLPVDKIKIDKSIVDNYLRDETEGFISSLSKLIHSLNMAITVEGVEEEWQFKTLKKWKFDYIQGFLFSRPLNGEEAGRFIPQKID